jgi:hypothetical protein
VATCEQAFQSPEVITGVNSRLVSNLMRLRKVRCVMEKKVTSEMLGWPCDFTVEGVAFNAKEKAWKVEFSGYKWDCKGVTLGQIVDSALNAGNNLRVGFVNKELRPCSTQAEVDAILKVAKAAGLKVRELLAGGRRRREISPEVWAATKSKAEIEAKIKELQAIAAQAPNKD